MAEAEHPPDIRWKSMGKKLKLRAEDEEDLRIIAAVLQDALIAVGDIKYLPEEHRFVLIANRFCWEAMPCDPDAPIMPNDCFERVHTGLRIENVTAVRQRGIDKLDAAQLLELLTIQLDRNGLILLFAGDTAIRVETDQTLCFIEDLDEPWPTKWRPHHAADGVDGTVLG
jgi:hypothetical protein